MDTRAHVHGKYQARFNVGGRSGTKKRNAAASNV